MFRLQAIILLIFILMGCDKHRKPKSAITERQFLLNMMSTVSQDMDDMGFPVDLSRVSISIKDPSAMDTMFNSINNESQRVASGTLLFGPVEVNVGNFHEEGANETMGRLAFYDPNTKTIVFTKGAGRLLTKGYLAHELAHVYQDQKWGFNNIWQKYQTNPSPELYNITQFVIEGHAELVRQTYEQRDAQDSADISAMSVTLGKYAEPECIECFSVKSLGNLPYSLGLRFLVHQFQKGGWKKAESFLANLPESSEQIIHPKKLGIDKPAAVSLPTFSDETNDTKLVLNGPLGEAFLLNKLLSLKVPVKEAFSSASGFDGDMAQLYQTAEGKEALVWRIVFDRDEDADQFETTLRKIPEAFVIMRSGQVIDWVTSDETELAKKLGMFLGEHPQSATSDPEDARTTRDQEFFMRNEKGLLINPYYD